MPHIFAADKAAEEAWDRELRRAQAADDAMFNALHDEAANAEICAGLAQATDARCACRKLSDLVDRLGSKDWCLVASVMGNCPAVQNHTPSVPGVVADVA